ncbi:aldo/keto reductase [Lacimicrobium alkaliphilum]|uniref:Aldo/keto reductase n=1 Tax=Lacimicrobium alkaliphilum TaxID=1526571 RepID=A0A0U3B2B3_9ALTE|nr:aldo/keto reductase [Lacimicrobium alkaliphilum]ALS99200.1 aldo/keto reductase [Lacimicrobium alkaliphilum]
MVARRQFLQGMLATGLCSALSRHVFAQSDKLIMRPLGTEGVQIPAIGMGTWITFNVGKLRTLRKQRAQVLDRFFRLGGRVIDSSPMYGSAEEVVGYALEHTGHNDKVFSATKTWTSSVEQGKEQFSHSLDYWQQQKINLLQIHNLVNWQGHLETLQELKQASRIDYIGITTSHGRRHSELEKVMLNAPVDTVQLTYNLIDRQAEQRLLPLAREKGIAVIANRPFQGGPLVDRLQRYALPGWAAELGCDTWPALLLKFIIGHPAITCAIPATSKVEHMQENMQACKGPLPDQQQRQQLLAYVSQL